MKILFLAANPVDVVTRLRIDKEFREIGQKIRLGTLRDQVELVSEWAVRAGDLPETLLNHQPDIVHFSGHCSPSGGIILEDEAGNRKVVSIDAIADLFRIRKDNIRVVVLNACYGKEQAQALAKVIDFTIGTSTALEDKAALVFGGQFYQSLADGCSVKESFELAVNQLSLEGLDVADVPELFVREGVNASESRIVKRSSVAAAGVGPREPAFTTGIDRPLMLAADREQTTKPQSGVFLSWLFGGIAFSLTTDILRRFVGGDGGWPDVFAASVQSFLIVFSLIAVALVVTSLVRPANHFVERAARVGDFGGLQSHRAVALTGIALVIALGIWLSLPIVARYYNERGVRFQYREQPDLSRARESYQQAVRLKPRYAQAHYSLATVQEDLQPEKAMEEYLLAIRYDNHIYAAYNNLARLYLVRGKDNDYENALNILSRAADLSPLDDNVSYSLNKNLGWANYALKHYPLAEVYLRRAISLRGEQGGASAHCLLAYVLKEQGNAGAADECFDCVSLAPGETDVEAKWLSDAKDCLMKGGGQ